MDAMTDKQLKKYIHSIHKELMHLGDKKEMKKLESSIFQNAVIYFEENPNSTFSDFENDFGSCASVIDAFLSGEYTDDLYGHISTARFKKKMILIISISVFIVLGIIFCFYLKAYTDVNDSTIESEQTIIY